MIGSLKRIARRPSLLLKGKTGATALSDTDEELNSFGSGVSEEQEVSNDYGRHRSARKSGQPLTAQQSANTTRSNNDKKEKKGRLASGSRRRASTGGAAGRSSFSAFGSSLPSVVSETAPLSNKQAKFPEADAAAEPSYPPPPFPGLAYANKKSNSPTNSPVKEQRNPVTSRRHSLDYLPSPLHRRHAAQTQQQQQPQEPKPLYTVRPESSSDEDRRHRDDLLSSVRRRGLDGTFHRSTSTRSGISVVSHASHGSSFTSTGWSVCSGHSSPRRGTRDSFKKENAAKNGIRSLPASPAVHTQDSSISVVTTDSDPDAVQVFSIPPKH